MLHMLVARQRGAALVLGADRIRSRLDRANDLGAHATLDVEAGPLRERVLALTDNEGAEIVIVTPGVKTALETAASCVARGGTIVAFTPLAPGETWGLDVNELFFRDINIVMSYSAGPADTREALDLLAGGLPVARLFTHRFGLEEAAAAYAALKNPEEALKVIVYPNE